jgi:methionyl-tRNA formyltransferase
LKVWRAEIAGADNLQSPSTTPGEVLSADKSGLVVACRDGALRLLEVQQEGGRRLPIGEFLAGHPLPIHARLG